MNSGNQSEGLESQPQASLCSGGCGFFANVGSSGLCSKCFREAHNAEKAAEAVAQKAAEAVSRPAPSPSPALVEDATNNEKLQEQQQHVSPASALAAAGPSMSASGASPPPPSNPSRCNVTACRKKLGLTGFKCRCGHSFCGQHRHAETHNCTFDYKTFERLKIADSNPLVQASKIQKI